MGTPTAPTAGQLDPAARRVGTLLDGKWTLDRLLGVGGMAAVYAATHRNGARAAIKLFPFSVTTSAESAERILREGYLANKIGHPAVVRVLDDHLDREREYAYLVMELLEGETARQRVESGGPLSPLEAIRFTMDLSDCLAAAHAKGVVHRDIKPENLFVTTDGKLKVLDFGVARALDGSSSSVTRTGAMLGTPAYMSPEQARGRPSEISPRSDVYSAGATLLFLVSGEYLHEGESAQEIMVRAAWTPARSVADRDLGLPRQLTEIIDRACAFDPADRHESAVHLKEALARALAELEHDPDARSPRARRSRTSLAPPGMTAPVELSRPRAVEETVAEGRAASGDPALTLSAYTSRAVPRALAALAVLLVTGVLGLLLLRQGPATAPDGPPARSPAVAPPPSRPPATAALAASPPTSEPTVPPPAPTEAKAAPAPASKVTPVRSAPRVTATTEPRRTAPSAPGSVGQLAPAPAPPPPPKPTSHARDVGY